MDNFIKLYTDFLNEAESTKGDFKEFSEARLAGATKITEAAKENGGPAMLTYHHFVVKLPYYKKAAAQSWLWSNYYLKSNTKQNYFYQQIHRSIHS